MSVQISIRTKKEISKLLLKQEVLWVNTMDKYYGKPVTCPEDISRILNMIFSSNINSVPLYDFNAWFFAKDWFKITIDGEEITI